MINKQPKLAQSGLYQLSFNGQISIISEKNTILLSKIPDIESGKCLYEESIYIRKFNSQTIMIDTFQEYSEIVLFSIGLSIILSK